MPDNRIRASGPGLHWQAQSKCAGRAKMDELQKAWIRERAVSFGSIEPDSPLTGGTGPNLRGRPGCRHW